MQRGFEAPEYLLAPHYIHEEHTNTPTAPLRLREASGETGWFSDDSNGEEKESRDT